MNKDITKVMIVSSVMSLLLLYFRIQWSGSLNYIFLVWNLFLAWIPFLCSLFLSTYDKRSGSKLQIGCLFFLWLVFFPNCPYILTDLFHLHLRTDVPLWFDLVLILCFAWNGLLLGFASLYEIQKFLKTQLSPITLKLCIGLLMVLCGFGIYLGRFPRYNSWDIFTNPTALFSDVFNMLIHPMQNTRMIGVTFFFSVFLMVTYWTLLTLIDQKKNEQQ